MLVGYPDPFYYHGIWVYHDFSSYITAPENEMYEPTIKNRAIKELFERYSLMNANYLTEVTAGDIAGIPHQISIETVQTVTNFEFRHSFLEMQLLLANFAVVTIQRIHPTWNRNYILDNVNGFVIGEDRDTLAQTLDETPHITSGEVHPRSIRAQLINTPTLFEFLVSIVAQSNGSRDITNIRWFFTFDLTTIMTGNGQIKIPEWVGVRDAKATWIPQTLRGHKINCAAFAVCFGLASKQHRSRLLPIQQAAWDMTRRYGWEDIARVDQILDLISRDYPTYRITILVCGKNNHDSFTRSGDQFEYIETTIGGNSFSL